VVLRTGSHSPARVAPLGRFVRSYCYRPQSARTDETRAPSVGFHAGQGPREVGPLDHAFQQVCVLAWRAFSRCANRGFTPLRRNRQRELRGRCTASVQHLVLLLPTVPACGPLCVPPVPSADSSQASSGDDSALRPFPWHATSRGTGEASRGKRSSRPCRDAGCIKHRPPRPRSTDGAVLSSDVRQNPLIRLALLCNAFLKTK
jgi:hypothetical protein